MGEFTFDGKITGKSKIDSGVGEIKINLIDKNENYTIDISKGIGTITLDGEKVEELVKDACTPESITAMVEKYV